MASTTPTSGLIFRAALACAVLLAGCDAKSPRPAEVRKIPAAQEQTAATCRDCHLDIHKAWEGTDHARANRPVDPRLDRAAFTEVSGIGSGTSRFLVSWAGTLPAMKEQGAAGAGQSHEIAFLLGAKPLWQPLVSAPGGRWQPTDMAYDVVRHEWFNVFGQENRNVGEWGHWTGRGMNWNSMCAQCHMTGFRKGYDASSDSYKSTWVEHGISCIQCHGPMPESHFAHHRDSARKASGQTAPPPDARSLSMETCAPCHARNEQLTNSPRPGDRYFDNYRPTLPVSAVTFYPDGQQRDEDFDWTSMLLSRMGGHAGVTCLDCHDPHSTRTILPVTGNTLCLQCHASPGRTMPNGTKAVPIEPLSHSHHAETGTGNSCVSCHMPTTMYMQRSPRHDHGFLKPDPLLTRELGIPNACNRCHADKSVDWAVEASERWYGSRLESRQRLRTRSVAAAQAGRAGSTKGLLALLAAEDIPAWRATYLQLLSTEAGDPTVQAAARSALADPDPLVRSTAVQVLNGNPAMKDFLRPLLADPFRIVRIDAAWALSSELPADSAARRELDEYLHLNLDQPAGRLRIGNDLANRGDYPGAMAHLATAVKWDPLSPGLRDAYGMILSAGGRPSEAAVQFARAAEQMPEDATFAYKAALAYAEAGETTEAERAIRLAVKRDPQFARAWYNLGLLLAQSDRLAEACDALGKAEALDSAEPDYPYATATVLLRMGDRAGAQAAARRVLGHDPNHVGATQLLRQP